MIDYLKELCEKLGIQLIYTNNKYTLLSCGYQINTPVIRVQKLFKNCPEIISKAVISYYTEYGDKDNYLKTINDYIDKKYGTKAYKINPPEDSFLEHFKSKNLNIKEGQESFIETDISSIILIDFNGKSRKLNPEDTIKALDNDITELDIVINPSKS